MATTNVLLREEVEDLGGRGDIVKVRAGYARNYLLPRKLAVEATTGNVKQIERERATLLKRESEERASAETRGGAMKNLNLNFTRKVGEHGILYGSVTSMDIAEALKERGYEIDRRRISLREPIKETGEFAIAVRLHRDVTVEVPVTVRGEGEAATATSGQNDATASPVQETRATEDAGTDAETTRERAETPENSPE